MSLYIQLGSVFVNSPPPPTCVSQLLLTLGVLMVLLKPGCLLQDASLEVDGV